ncbi:RibD family protein [Vreelandella sp. EE22]
MMQSCFFQGGVMPDSDGVISSAPKGEIIDAQAAWHWLLTTREGAISEVPITVDSQGDWQSGAQTTPEAETLLTCLLPLVLCKNWNLAQLGQSLDGRIATESGHSHYINGFESLVHLHRLRALADAVVIGAGTASADNPQLTVRHVSGHHPVRVVLDPRGRVPRDLALFQSDGPPTLHITGPGFDLPGSHATQCVLALNEAGQFDPVDVIELLQARGYQRILIEGGGITISQFIEAGAIDYLHLLVAPLLIGSGRPGLQMTPIDTLETALRPRMRTFRCGDDTLFDVCLNADAAIRGRGLGAPTEGDPDARQA